MKRVGRFLHDDGIEHWRFEVRHGGWWLHSVDAVAFHLGDRYVQGRMKHTENWYVLLGDARMSLWRKEIYAVRREK